MAVDESVTDREWSTFPTAAAGGFNYGPQPQFYFPGTTALSISDGFSSPQRMLWGTEKITLRMNSSFIRYNVNDPQAPPPFATITKAELRITAVANETGVFDSLISIAPNDGRWNTTADQLTTIRVANSINAHSFAVYDSSVALIDGIGADVGGDLFWSLARTSSVDVQQLGAGFGVHTPLVSQGPVKIVNFKLRRKGTFTLGEVVRCDIFAAMADDLTDDTPTGLSLGRSASHLCQSISTSTQTVNFVWSSPVSVTVGKRYVAVISTDYVPTGTKYLEVQGMPAVYSKAFGGNSMRSEVSVMVSQGPPEPLANNRAFYSTNYLTTHDLPHTHFSNGWENTSANLKSWQPSPFGATNFRYYPPIPHGPIRVPSPTFTAGQTHVFDIQSLMQDYVNDITYVRAGLSQEQLLGFVLATDNAGGNREREGSAAVLRMSWTFVADRSDPITPSLVQRRSVAHNIRR